MGVKKIGPAFWTTGMGSIGENERAKIKLSAGGKSFVIYGEYGEWGERGEKLLVKRIKRIMQTKPVSVHLWTSYFSHSEIYYLYKNNIYRLDRQYSVNEVLLLIMDYEDKERRKFERLRKKFELAQEIEKQPRKESIPEDVRIAVWRKDEGKCARCGSREKLEYDHIIPVSKGGSNTVRNIELLCESCNRKKKNNII